MAHNLVIEKLYHHINSPAGFAGAHVLYKEAKKIDPKITKKDIEKWLENDRTYTLHRPRRIHFERSKTVPAGIYSDVQMDLADFKKLSRYNNGNKYILVAIDVLSKTFFASPVKSKSYNDMVNAMDSLLEKIPITPARIFTDCGKEFILKKEYYEKKGINKCWSSTKTIKASLAERAIRTLKSRIYKYFSEKHSLNWVEILPAVIKSINNTVSRATGLKPVQINFKNAQKIWEKNYGKEFSGKHHKPAKLKVGDPVRLANYKEVFDRGYLPNWSDEILQVKSIKPGRVNTFNIQDDKGVPFKGKYYKEDLGKTTKDTTYRIEKVFKEKIIDGIPHLFVKFFGYNTREWIKKTDIV